MKKIKLFILPLIILGLIGAFSFAQAKENQGLHVGSRSNEVKALQRILKQDPGIYPEGYVTGYYGTLTEKAIKKIQKKCNVPETGIIDPATEKCIFPVDYKVTVLFPNGGEAWDRSQLQTIKWDAVLTTTQSQEEGVRAYPFWKKVSIDLFRKEAQESVFVKHVATVDLSDESYTWKIANDIPNGSNYIIRISAGRNVLPMILHEEEGSIIRPEEIWTLPPHTGIFWDESDGKFSIAGSNPQPQPHPDFGELIKLIEKISQELAQAIEMLRKIDQSY